MTLICHFYTAVIASIKYDAVAVYRQISFEHILRLLFKVFVYVIVAR